MDVSWRNPVKWLQLPAGERLRLGHLPQISNSWSLKKQNKCQQCVNNAVLSFIVQGLQPFALVEQPSFQTLVQDLQPNCTVTSGTTVRLKTDKATAVMKEQVEGTMRKTAYIATTTDYWTARRRSFIGVTAHWLDPGSLRGVLLALHAGSRRTLTHLMSWHVQWMTDTQSMKSVRK